MMNENPQQLKEQGQAAFQRGAYDEALALFEQAAAGFAAQDDAVGQGEMVNNMGVIYRVKREWDTAVTTLAQAQTLFQQAGDVNRQAQTLGNLGDLYAARKKRDNAARCYSQAAALFAQTGDGDKQSQVLRALSLLRLRQGHWLEAMMRMEESLTTAPRLGLGKWLLRVLLRFALGLMGGR
ncbi:MAG: tetratricopeptide repeat protein [Ardenticatenaceae bacterium]|nr:tetratricopeptide repeat protein [Ardenticatenaceae bacterium]MCB9443646.1 tetratricopeptide repeat protein [Ardenticatenaceae bacterium]